MRCLIDVCHLGRQVSMELSIEFRDGILWATVTGQVTLGESTKMCSVTCDAAVQSGVDRILVDASGADGDISDLDRYRLGETMAAYYITKPLDFKIAIVGNPPLVNGFVPLVASNRGITTETFSETTPAVKWLNHFAAREVARSKQPADLFEAVDEADRHFQEAKAGYKEALAIVADSGYCPDGNLALRQRAQEYDRAVKQYSEAVTTWLAYMETNREEALKLIRKEREGVNEDPDVARDPAKTEGSLGQ